MAAMTGPVDLAPRRVRPRATAEVQVVPEEVRPRTGRVEVLLHHRHRPPRRLRHRRPRVPAVACAGKTLANSFRHSADARVARCA